MVLIKPKSWERHGLKPWIEAAKKRLHRNVLAMRSPTSSPVSPGAFSLVVSFEVRKVDEAAAQPA